MRTIFEIETLASRSTEKTKEAMCDCCRWPFAELTQEELTEHCDTCEVMGKMKEMEKMWRLVGCACVGTVALEHVEETLGCCQISGTIHGENPAKAVTTPPLPTGWAKL